MNTLDKETIAVEFGAFIREARERKGMLQSDVATKLGVSRAYYCYIESGSRDIYFSLAMKICAVLDLNFNDFAKRML
jgi:transcriptional regulator with XRE-family HTH domain